LAGAVFAAVLAGLFFAGAFFAAVGAPLRRRPLGALVREHLHRDLERDVLHLLAARDRHVRLAVGDVRAEPAVRMRIGLPLTGSASNSASALAARRARTSAARRSRAPARA
jgi:hypothetical protein